MGTIVIMQEMKPQHLDKLQQLAPDWKIIAGKDASVWEPFLKEAEIVVGWNQEAAEPMLSPDAALRWVQVWSAGVNGLPLERLQERNILLTNASGVHPNPISETVFAMMLSFTRKIHTYTRQQQQKYWYHANLGDEIHNRSIAVVGVGAIGQEIARLAKAFHMTVYGVRRNAEPLEHVDTMLTMEQLPDIAGKCDFIINALPLTLQTTHVFNDALFQRMKKETFFVNIGRGQAVDTEALVRALQEGRIAGAGLDVFEEEPLPQDHPLWEMDNVIITPHTSGGTRYYNDRVADIFATNLQQYLAGSLPPLNLVDYSAGY